MNEELRALLAMADEDGPESVGDALDVDEDEEEEEDEDAPDTPPLNESSEK